MWKFVVLLLGIVKDQEHVVHVLEDRLLNLISDTVLDIIRQAMLWIGDLCIQSVYRDSTQFKQVSQWCTTCVLIIKSYIGVCVSCMCVVYVLLFH